MTFMRVQIFIGACYDTEELLVYSICNNVYSRVLMMKMLKIIEYRDNMKNS